MGTPINDDQGHLAKTSDGSDPMKSLLDELRQEVENEHPSTTGWAATSSVLRKLGNGDAYDGLRKLYELGMERERFKMKIKREVERHQENISEIADRK
jgi:hypothetical protein